MNTHRIDQIQAEVWVKEYYMSIYRYCYFKTANSATAQDITQEVFCRFFQRIEFYDQERKIKQILFMIAHNLCIDHYRKRDTTRKQLEQETIDHTIIHDVERTLAIQAIMKQLPEPLKETLILRYYYDFKLKEIAMIMDTSISNVKYRMTKGKEEMKQLIEKEGMHYDEWF